MYLNVVKRILSLIVSLASILFIILSFHSYFILKKADFTFFITTLVGFSICLTISLLALFDKIKISLKPLDEQSKLTNLTLGASSVILSLVVAYYIWMRRGFGNLYDVFGIAFFGIGGLAIILKSITKK